MDFFITCLAQGQPDSADPVFRSVTGVTITEPLRSSNTMLGVAVVQCVGNLMLTCTVVLREIRLAFLDLLLLGLTGTLRF